MTAPDRIKLVCPTCRAPLVVPNRPGKKGKCPRCKGPILIPEEEESGELELAIPGSDEHVAPREPAADELDLMPAAPDPEPARARALDREAPIPERAPVAAPPAPAPIRGARRHLHWALALALLPLAASMLTGDRDTEARWERTVEELTPADEAAIERLPKDATLDDLLRLLPDQRIQGAHLGRDSRVHWLYALLAAGAFLGVVLAFPRGSTSVQSVVVVAAFTATAGVVLLLSFQWIAGWTQGVMITGRGLGTLLFYVVKFIGFSYRAALDPSNGFLASLFGFTFGVGLCEELCKALPIIWHYRNRATLDWRAAFLWGLASGAGFGIAEGVHYAGEFYNGASTGGIYVVRFVSCVALHAVWTGGVGILIARDPTRVQSGMEWWSSILAVLSVLAVAMTLHGLYDTLLKRDLFVVALLCAVGSVGWLGWLVERAFKEETEAA